VRFLTPTPGPNSPAITTRDRSTCRTDALSIARLTYNDGRLHHQLGHLIAVSDPVDVATPLATSAGTVIVVGVRHGACRAGAFARSPQTTRGSRR
jgi:hypothetical protein